MLLKAYNDYYNGYDEDGEYKLGYVELISRLTEQFPLGQPIIGEEAQKKFIRLYGTILRLKNILSAFDDFEGNEILPDRNFQDYQSIYIDLYQDFTKDKDTEKKISMTPSCLRLSLSGNLR